MNRKKNIQLVCDQVRGFSSKAMMKLGDSLDKKELQQKQNLSLGETFQCITDAVCGQLQGCLLYTSPSPRDKRQSRMPSSA